MDNRLDYISNIDQDGLDLMSDYRKTFIALDESLRLLTQHPEKPLNPSAARTLALARTNLEISLQFTIKTLCIQFENKE
jgi:hypothetical protein